VLEPLVDDRLLAVEVDEPLKRQGFLVTYPARFSRACVSSADIGSSTCAEKPGCLQAMSFVASSGEPGRF